MWPFRKRQQLSDQIFGRITVVASKIRDQLDEAMESGVIKRPERHALAFVTLGAMSTAFTFLTDNDAPFKKLRKSDLPSFLEAGATVGELSNASLGAYIVLLKIFFYLLSKAMEDDENLSFSIGATFDDMLSKFADITGFSADMFKQGQNSRDVENREGAGYMLDINLADFRMTLCGKIEGLSRWRVPGSPYNGDYLHTVIFFRAALDQVSAHNLAILRSNLA